MPTLPVFLILVLAAYRLTRLAGWDDFPLVANLRARLIGERWILDANPASIDQAAAAIRLGARSREELAAAGYDLRDEEVELPGKTPDTEVEGLRPAYDRPTLAHLIHCPFCVGWWISLAVFLAWVCAGAPGQAIHSWVFYGVTPFAISGAVGLIAKNLDA